LVDAMLQQQAACSVGSLVTWVVQQQPEQHVRAVSAAGHQGSATVIFASSTAASIWAAGVHLLGRFAAAAAQHTAESAACKSAARLTQQLDQSGKVCSCGCT
jgi:hypothetical protein